MDGNRKIASFIRKIKWETLPNDVREKVKACLLDVLGATLCGTLSQVSHIATEYATRAWPGCEATILLGRNKSTAAGAAFANGCAANAMDIDDIGRYHNGHAGAEIFSTALAISEKLHKNGKEMLTAMVVGYEVAHRSGRCWHDHYTPNNGSHAWCSVADAAAAAYLMELDEEKILNALGIAEYHAPNMPMERGIKHPTMVKHAIGWGAMTGVTSAELAQRGFTAIPSILGFDKYQRWISDIGEHYIMVTGVGFKKYACCAWAQSAMEAAYELMQRNGFNYKDIEHIHIETFHDATILGVDLPETTEEAQFNLAWPLAALLIDGEVGPKQILEERLNDEKIIDLVKKITMVESDELTEAYSILWRGDPKGIQASRVWIELKDGTKFDSGVTGKEMEYGQEWSRDKIEKKFRWLSGLVLNDELINRTVKMVWDFDNVVNVNEFTGLLK